VAPLPYVDHGAKIAFYLVIGAFAVLELRLRVRSGLNRQGSRADRGSYALVYVTTAAGIVAAFALAGWHGGAIRDWRWPVFVLGMFLMAAGVAIRQWAVALLGAFFTVDVRVHAEQAVVDTGPYRWVRHPSYTGLLITFAGIGLALGNWAALAAALLVPTAGLLVRIRVEERALLEGLGEPYHRFATGRARLFPGMW
jgi:protein-S-isoprenylcysteine O-methyltransferase Ste14